MKNISFFLLIFFNSIVLAEDFCHTDYHDCQQQAFIIASGVRVRIEPNTQAKVVASLQFGDQVQVINKTKSPMRIGSNIAYWYQIKLADNTIAWIYGSLLAPLKDNAVASYQILLEQRLEKDLDFSEIKEVVLFLETIDYLQDGKLTFLYLKFLEKAITLLNADYDRKTYQVWASQHRLLYHDEISNQWYLKRLILWKMAEYFIEDPMGDVLAWYAATAPRGGECEGDVVCMLSAVLDSEVAYLKYYPHGQYQSQALENITNILIYIDENRKNLIYQPGDEDFFLEALDNVLIKVEDID